MRANLRNLFAAVCVTAMAVTEARWFTMAFMLSGGGDVVPSFGGWSGNKLLKAIDIENIDEFENATAQDRILGALKIVKRNKPPLKTIVTFGPSTTGPTSWGQRLITQAKALGANIDVFTIMPFAQQENTSPATWTQIRDWAAARHLARLAFWAVNRDRPCPGGGVVSNCSGISRRNWQFTSITANYNG